MPASVMADYRSYLITSAALCLALALPLAAGALAGRCWKGSSIRSLWLFGLVPVIGFVGHTAVEPFLAGTEGGSSPASLVQIALVGVVIQIPFALVAVGLARRVLWLAESLARALAPCGPTTVAPALPHWAHTEAIHTLAFRLDLAYTERGPPLLAA